MGRHEGAVRAFCALVLIIVAGSAPPCSASDNITADISGNGSFTFNLPGRLIIDPGLGGNYSGNLTGPGTVIKRGAGLAIFSSGVGSNYTGGTFIEGGTFLVNNSFGRPFGVGPVQVSGGATLGGSGGTRGLVTIAPDGILSPDNGPGNIDIHAGLDLQLGSILKMELTGATPDRVNIDGGVFTSEGAIVRVVAADLPATPGKVYTLIDWTGTTTANITADQFSLDGVIGGSLRVPAGTKRLELVVPEPTALLAAFPALALLLKRRRR